MNPADPRDAGDLAGETAAALAAAVRDLGAWGGRCGAGVVFNGILRRLEIDASGLTDRFLEAGGFDGVGLVHACPSKQDGTCG